MTTLNTIIEEERCRFAKELSQSVRYFCGKGQYEENSDEQKAYLDGVETAIGMMFIDITETPKSKGLFTTAMQRAYEVGREENPLKGERRRIIEQIREERDAYWKEGWLKELHKEMEEDIERAMKAGVPISVAGYAKVTALLRNTPITNKDNLK